MHLNSEIVNCCRVQNEHVVDCDNNCEFYISECLLDTTHGENIQLCVQEKVGWKRKVSQKEVMEAWIDGISKI